MDLTTYCLGKFQIEDGHENCRLIYPTSWGKCIKSVRTMKKNVKFQIIHKEAISVIVSLSSLAPSTFPRHMCGVGSITMWNWRSDFYLKDIGVFASELVYFKVFLVPVLLTADDRLVEKEWILARKKYMMICAWENCTRIVQCCIFISIMITWYANCFWSLEVGGMIEQHVVLRCSNNK